MREEDKPADAPAAPPAPPTAAPPAPVPAERKPSRVDLMREKAGRRSDRADSRRGPVPNIKQDEGPLGGPKPKIEKFDDAMERELQEAMAGFDDKALLA